ncbi:Retroelement [Phytophthora megakarya]|uniref:Retroelement n=1 Tax=Phytophthora megakarya TaxID=4795 RepID=A0A225UNE3_9STRA|nr:Retroelement [Phytophthora megakarya]
MVRRKPYADKDLDDAVDRVLAGELVSPVSKDTNIPRITLSDHVKRAQAGTRHQRQRPGPAPLLPDEAENSIFEWVVARQQVGHPVCRTTILRRASDISMLLYQKELTDGWYTRFMDRHPMLTNRVAQAINKVRNNVDESHVNLLFKSLTKAISDTQMDPGRIFIVDETAFKSHKKTKTVVAVRGSSNVWKTEMSTSFHMSIVACGSAHGFVVPPLFILTGKTVNVSLLSSDKTGAAVTTTESGFMNNWLFIRWLKFFAEQVPAEIKRPLLLIMDGCSSHISLEVVDMADELEIMLVCLPANSTHLFQPLDVAVFGSFKSKLQFFIDLMGSDKSDNFSIPKDAAVEMAGLAWNNCNFSANIKAGFKGCGIYPLSRERMMDCLDEFKRNGVPKEVEQHTWSQVESVVQDNILVLPPPRKSLTARKKRVTVGGQLLTRKLLEEVAATNAPKKKQKKTNKTKKPKKPAKSTGKRARSSTEAPSRTKRQKTIQAGAPETPTSLNVNSGEGETQFPSLFPPASRVVDSEESVTFVF